MRSIPEQIRGAAILYLEAYLWRSPRPARGDGGGDANRP